MSTALELSIDGDDTVADALLRCEYVEAIDRLDTLIATFNVHHHADASILDKIGVGLRYEVRLMEDGAAVTTAAGDVVEVRHVRRAGIHRVTVVGLDSLHRLRVAHAPAQVWEVSHDQIASEIADRNGLTASVEGVDGTASELLQNEGSDALFLKRLAAENNYVVRVENDELFFGRKQGTGADLTVALDEQPWVDIEQRTSLDGLVTKVTVHGSDYVQDEAFTGEAAAADLTGISGGATGVSILQDMAGDRALILNQAGYGDASSATARAKAELQARADNFLTGSVWLPGTPAAHSGRGLTLSGGGAPFDGTFVIRQTAHIRDGRGYRTRVDFFSDSLPSAT